MHRLDRERLPEFSWEHVPRYAHTRKDTAFTDEEIRYPATKILYYRDVIVHCGGYAADSSLKNIPGAFLVNRNGNDKLIRNRVPVYGLTNQALRDWWIDAAKQVCADPAIDGIFLDGVVKILEPGFLKGAIGEEK